MRASPMLRSPLRLAFLAVLFAATLRCGLEPDDQLILSGAVADVSGNPQSDAGVVLTRTEQSGCPGTFHVALNGQNKPVAFDSFETTQTDPSGAYAFDIWRFQAWTANSPNSNRCFRLEVDGDNGSASLLQVSGAAFNSGAPDMQLWFDQPQISPGADGGLVAQNPTLLSAPINAIIDGGAGDFVGTPAIYDWVLLQGSTSAWHSLDLGDALNVDPPLVEDFSVCLGVEALFVPTGIPTRGGVPAAAAFAGMSRSGLACLPKGNTVPLSRGKSCAFNGTSLPKCPLTDGVLDVFALRGDGGTPSTQDQIDIDLGQSTAVAAIVIRGLMWSGSITKTGDRTGPPPTPAVPMSVLGSVDNQTFTPIASVQPLPLPLQLTPEVLYGQVGGRLADYRVDLPAAPQLRYLRLLAGAKQAFWAVQEVSAFAP